MFAASSRAGTMIAMLRGCPETACGSSERNAPRWRNARAMSQTTAISHRIENNSSTSDPLERGPPGRSASGGRMSRLQCGATQVVPLLVAESRGRAIVICWTIGIATRGLPEVRAIPICKCMSHRMRDIVLMICALICAAAAVYVVYNIEVFKHRYDLQLLQSDQQQ